eukprot:INCI1279.1.p2 GENE.INCI1279.1~~INCI1279.1.p2  ORF type:complete len:298 (-),score=95.60 INCI1279.1:122-1015(-)
MGNGVSGSIPETVTKDQAREFLGDKFDEAKFDAAAKDGVVDKATFEAAVAEAAAAEAGEQAQEKSAAEGANTTEGGAAKAEEAQATPAAEAEGAAATATDFAPDPENVPQTDVEAFHSLVRWNKDIPAIKEKISATAGMVHARDAKNGNFALHIAAQNNHVELVRLLLDSKADPNKQNLAGQTALHMTQTYELAELSDMLLNAGADPELKNEEGHPAKRGLEGKQNVRYSQLKAIIENPTEAALVAFFEEAKSNPENLDKTEIMKTVNFQAKKAMKANGSWTDTVNTQFTELVRALP